MLIFLCWRKMYFFLPSAFCYVPKHDDLHDICSSIVYCHGICWQWEAKRQTSRHDRTKSWSTDTDHLSYAVWFYRHVVPTLACRGNAQWNPLGLLSMDCSCTLHRRLGELPESPPHSLQTHMDKCEMPEMFTSQHLSLDMADAAALIRTANLYLSSDSDLKKNQKHHSILLGDFNNDSLASLSVLFNC